MGRLTKRAILSGAGFAITWTALTLILGGGTWYYLLIGLLGGISFGAATYWLGKRFNRKNRESST